VELYAEANSTGEKAEWLRSTPVTLKGAPDDRRGVATGEFKVRNRFPHEPPSATHPHLPYASLRLGWTALLILKDGDHLVATSAPVHAPFNWTKQIRVPD
jgi:hypothetical protein